MEDRIKKDIYNVKVNIELQQIAAISNHLIPTVASFLKWAPDPHQVSFILILKNLIFS